MYGEVIKQSECRLCKHKRFTRVLSLEPTPIADAFTKNTKNPQYLYPLNLYKCGSCDFSQILDVIDPEILYKDYIYVTTSSMGLNQHFEKYADEVISTLKLAPGSKILDIGSNDGSLLKSFKKREMNVFGVEPATEIAKEANRQGIKTFCEFFNNDIAQKIEKETTKVDCLTINNLYANIHELEDVTKGIKHMLNDNGVFVFESFYLLDFIQNTVFDFMYHEHINYFSVKPLIPFFKRLGLELFHVESVPTKGGSIRCFVQQANGPKAISPSIEAFLKKEEAAHLYGKDNKIFTDYQHHIGQIGIELKSLLSNYKSKGKSIACYGASCTTTTLLYHFGLVDMIDYMLDDNEAKINTFSPRAHIPVHSGDDIQKYNPDIVLIAAWRFSTNIISKHKDYFAKKTIVVPLPTIKVINPT